MCCANMAKARWENDIVTLKKHDIADHLTTAIKTATQTRFHKHWRGSADVWDGEADRMLTG